MTETPQPETPQPEPPQPEPPRPGTPQYKVKVTVGDATVEVEGAESGVVAIVKALSQVLGGRSGGGSPREGPAPAVTPSPVEGPKDARTFFKENKPGNDSEAAACAAFYLQYLAPDDGRKDTIDATELLNVLRMANWPLPGSAKQTLVNAKNAGYLDAAGERGKYRLNPVGYNLVQHTLGAGESTKGRVQKKAPKEKG